VGDQSRDENRSVWVSEYAERAARDAGGASSGDAGAASSARPPLRGRAVADVVIVGGGLTGVSTAWHLAARRPQLGIALLEAGVLGQGASGRSGGQVLHGINGVTPDTPESRRRIHAVTGLGIDLAEEWASRFAPGAFRRGGCLEIYTDARRAEAAHAEIEARRAAGIPAEFFSQGELPIAGARGAVLDPRAGRLNGFALLQGMRRPLVDAGVALHEHTRVRRIHVGTEVVCESADGELRARALVLATNAYTPSLGFFRSGILPLHSHALATAPLDDARWRQVGWGAFEGLSDDLDRIAYACRTPGGRLVFGGGGNAAYAYRFGGSPFAVRAPSAGARAGGDRATRFMRGVMARYFPSLAGVPIEHRWSGALAITLDRVCSMGVMGEARNLYYALGYSGHGIALALLAGRVLADLYEGNDEPWRNLPFHQKRLLPLPPEPLRWIGYQLYTRLTGKSPRRS